MDETPKNTVLGLADPKVFEHLTQAKKVLNESGGVINSRPRDSVDDLDLDHKRAQLEDVRTDTALKKKFACWFIWILIGQLLVMNSVFIAIGLGALIFSDLTIQIYMGGTLTEVFGIVFIMCRYLFSKH